MKRTKPLPSGKPRPQHVPADRNTLEDNRASLMADAMEQMQRRGAISREQHDDQIREITRESAS